MFLAQVLHLFLLLVIVLLFPIVISLILILFILFLIFNAIVIDVVLLTVLVIAIHYAAILQDVLGIINHTIEAATIEQLAVPRATPAVRLPTHGHRAEIDLLASVPSNSLSLTSPAASAGGLAVLCRVTLSSGIISGVACIRGLLS